MAKIAHTRATPARTVLLFETLQVLVAAAENQKPLPGFEPGIFSLGRRRLNHWAKGAITLDSLS